MSLSETLTLAEKAQPASNERSARSRMPGLIDASRLISSSYKGVMKCNISYTGCVCRDTFACSIYRLLFLF